MNTRFIFGCLLAASTGAQADVITDWNTVAGQLIVDAKLGTPPANRAIAIVQTAVHDAVTASAAHINVDAAVAAANRVTLAKLLPSQEAALHTAYQAALAKLPDGPAKAAGIAVGEKAAAAVLARRLDDGAATPERYRPYATAGAYVPTSAVATPQWAQRKPWNLTSPSQFRPGPPPSMASAQWARDYDEVRVFGSKASPKRSAEQTEIARFWDYSLPPVYHAVLRSVATQPNRTVAQNARLFAAAAQAMDDGLIAVMDAKYHYNFWRPVTAIRNGDADGNDSTAIEAGWASLIDSPMHPEYPSAHSVLAGALTTILQAEAGPAGLPVLSTTSPTASGAMRKWKSLDDFAREVSQSRIWGGIHYRTSTDVGLAMGRQIGAQAVGQFALAPEVDGKPVERVAAGPR
jgi:putative NIF3 family GTP cyclohydrolase 1 type 2